MRIIAGEYRGRKIKQPGSNEVRPTKDRIREAVFNMIAAYVPGADVLDIFAGSGAYGLEALSRGAEKAVLIENNTGCADIISENINSLGLEECTKIMDMDAFNALELLGTEKDKFDLIFADPPYNEGLGKKTLIIINHYDILKPIGFLVVEHHNDEDIPGTEGNVSLFKQKTYGKTTISIFRKK